jgi:hypothetical protein
MKRRLSVLTLLSLGLAGQAGALSLTGTVQGEVTPDTRLGGWAVTPFGQPVQELVSAPVTGVRFTLSLPDAAPPIRAQVPVDDRLSWPGLIDLTRVSAPAQAAELKFYLYRDTNGNGSRDDGEPLREVRLNVGRGGVFVVWASAATTITGSREYQAALERGWNALVVEVRNTVRVQPYTPQTSVQIDLGR